MALAANLPLAAALVALAALYYWQSTEDNDDGI